MTDLILKHERRLLIGAILLYIAVFSGICLWKYGIFAYNALDLAIFNQVFWNTAHGRLFEMSIHPNSYLGDHAGLVILPLSLIYALLPDPRTLLTLQTIALAACAYPVWLIAGRRFAKASAAWRLGPLLFALAWLLNPLVHNINLFEFHLLPFALVPLFFAYLAYEDGRKLHFIVLAFLAMLVREDIAMVIAGFGILAAIERKSWWWRVVPIAVGAAWFAGAMTLVSRFTGDGAYKFQIYYSWLGGTPAEMATNAAMHPLRVLTHLVSLGNLEMLLGFGLPLLFLPYLAPSLLVLAAGPFAQMVLGAPGGSSVVLDTHYSTLFLPALFIAAIYALERESRKAKRRERLLPFVLLASVYGALIMGPLPHALSRISSGEDNDDARAARQILEGIPEGASVSASYRLLPHLSSRERVYSNHYVFLGVRQFGAGPYEVPADLRYVAFDSDDLQTYRAQMKETAWTRERYEGGRGRLAAVAGEEIARRGSFILFGKDEAGGRRESDVEGGREIGFEFKDGSVLKNAVIDAENLTVALDWRLGREDNDSKGVTVLLRREGELVDIIRMPLVNDLSQSAEPGDGYLQTVSLLPLASRLPHGRYVIGVTLTEYETMHVLDGIRSTMRLITDSQEIGGVDDIGYVDL